MTLRQKQSQRCVSKASNPTFIIFLKVAVVSEVQNLLEIWTCALHLGFSLVF